MKLFIRAAVAILLAAVVLAVLLRPQPLQRDAPRDLPWTLPDYRQANTSWEVAEDGRIHTHVEHFFLRGITPEMVLWFYQHLPISTVELNGVSMPLYHIFHPTEHGRIRVIENAPDGTPGMAVGAMIMREEWFGEFDSRGAARIVEFSPRGFLALPEAAGLVIGSVRHSLRAEPGGTAYEVDSVIGSELPFLGPLLNLYLRKAVFHPAMIEQWRRHQVEEVASLQFFLPQLYAQRGGDNHFVLNMAGPATAIIGPR